MRYILPTIDIVQPLRVERSDRSLDCFDMMGWTMGGELLPGQLCYQQYWHCCCDIAIVVAFLNCFS